MFSGNFVLFLFTDRGKLNFLDVARIYIIPIPNDYLISLFDEENCMVTNDLFNLSRYYQLTLVSLIRLINSLFHILLALT